MRGTAISFSSLTKISPMGLIPGPDEFRSAANLRGTQANEGSQHNPQENLHVQGESGTGLS
jgi:hypothetical protein